VTTHIGLVGAGFIAGRHVGSLTALDGVHIAGVADPVPERAGTLAERAGAVAYTSWQQLLESERLDALYVCVPPHAHGGVEDAAVDLGLPLFVEKPLAVDAGTALRLADRIADAGLLTAVGYHWRYLDTLALARELLADAPARLVLASWLDKAPRVDWWARQEQSGGQTVEQATHLFDVARCLVGEVESGSAVGSRSAHGPGDILDVCTAALRFESGAVGSFSNTCLLPGGGRIGVELVAPGLDLWLTEHALTVLDAAGERTVERQVDPIAAEDRAFVDAVRGVGDDVRAPYAEALRTHLLAVAVAEAAVSGGTVDLGRVAAPAGSAR
jgi:myo-inositol 2-dehydrogenase / D-chiro-inositol 1-dehydrogenase